MKIQLGDMWSCFDKIDNFIITTNAIVKYNGALVMGKGIAKQCRDNFPNIDQLMGQAITKAGREYGLILGNKVGIFQVKYDYRDKADLKLIEKSTLMLKCYAAFNPNKKIALNFPGIGNGKQAGKYEEILEIISVLPDNVTVWKFK